MNKGIGRVNGRGNGPTRGSWPFAPSQPPPPAQGDSGYQPPPPAQGDRSVRSAQSRLQSLSVVIPSYNTASMTVRCCHAVLAAAPAGRSVEVIVTDDGSSDGTAEVLARDVPEVRVVRLENNSGFAAAANAGVAAAHGQTVLLLNSD